MKPPFLLKESLVALGALAFGLICLPALIFLVGQQLVGEYEAGLLGLLQSIGNGLLAGQWYAWMLVLSPYLCLQLLRFGFWLHRRRRIVN